jgi:hypothetical protein
VVESGLRRETPQSTSIINPCLMKASIDLKKCEQNLKIVCRAISQKEAEKASLEEACSKRKTEMVTVHNSIRKSNNARNEIKDELIKIRSEVENKVNRFFTFMIVYLC